MFKSLLIPLHCLPPLKQLAKNVTPNTPLTPFSTAATHRMPLITSTGKPRVILGTMTFG